MKLADFQALFQARILAGGGAEDRPLLDKLQPSTHGAEREKLLGVYQEGYRARLAGFVAEDHPGLRGVLGEEAFDALVEDYVSAGPTTHRNARWYTTGLPDFMQASPRWRDNAAAVSMALFERAMVDAFDAADVPPLPIDELSKFAPDDWPRLAFAFHPSLTLLDLTAGTLDAYEAATNDDSEERETDDAPGDETEHVAVWRVGEESAYRQLEPDEYVALSEARKGHAFGDICQMAAFQQGGEIEPARLAQCLASWFEDGMVTAVRVAGEG